MGCLAPSLLFFLFPNENALASLFLGCLPSTPEKHRTPPAPANYCSSLSNDNHDGVDSEVEASQDHDPDADMFARVFFRELLCQAEQEVDRDEDRQFIDKLREVVDLLLKGPETDQDDYPDEVQE